jgi:hypothetical protein
MKEFFILILDCLKLIGLLLLAPFVMLFAAIMIVLVKLGIISEK